MHVFPSGGLVFIASHNLVFLCADIVATIVLLHAWFVITPAKKIVVFLRKFRHENSNKLFEKAIKAKGAKDYRLVTLDDEEFVPVGVSKIKTIALTLLLIAALFIVYLLIYNFMMLLDTFSDPLIFGKNISVSLYFIPLVLIGVTPVLTGVIVFLIWLWGNYLRFRMQLRVTTDEATIDNLANEIGALRSKKYSSGLLGPKSSIVPVVDAHWEEVVIKLCELSDIVLIDYPMNTDPLKWELDHVKTNVPEKLVVTAPDTLDPEAFAELSARGLDPLQYAGSESSDAKKLLSDINKKLGIPDKSVFPGIFLALFSALCFSHLYYVNILPHDEELRNTAVAEFSEPVMDEMFQNRPCIQAIQYADIQLIYFEHKESRCFNIPSVDKVMSLFVESDELETIDPEFSNAMHSFANELNNPHTNIDRLRLSFENIKSVCWGAGSENLQSDALKSFHDGVVTQIMQKGKDDPCQ